MIGLTNLSIAWRLAKARYGLPPLASPAIGILALAALAAIGAGHAVKLVTAWRDDHTEVPR